MATPFKPIAVSVADATRITGLGVTTLYKLIGDGRLTAVKVDGKRLINFESIERLLIPDTATAA